MKKKKSIKYFLYKIGSFDQVDLSKMRNQFKKC